MSLFEKLGGEKGIEKVVEVFYEKVLNDESVNQFFKETDMEKQKRHQTLFISWVTGGPNQYTGNSMEKAHEGMNLQEEHFSAIANHLSNSLRELNVSEADIDGVITKLLEMKEAILHR